MEINLAAGLKYRDLTADTSQFRDIDERKGVYLIFHGFRM
jgi:hypothetical protein